MVLARSCEPQVCPSAIGLVQIRVVYVARRPISSHVEPCEAVRLIGFLADFDAPVAPIIRAARAVAGPNMTSAVRPDAPSPDPCFRIIVQNCAQTLGRDADGLHNVPALGERPAAAKTTAARDEAGLLVTRESRSASAGTGHHTGRFLHVEASASENPILTKWCGLWTSVSSTWAAKSSRLTNPTYRRSRSAEIGRAAAEGEPISFKPPPMSGRAASACRKPRRHVIVLLACIAILILQHRVSFG